MNKQRSNHTFTKAPVCTQLITYIILTLQLLVFAISIQPNIQSYTSRTVLIILFSLTYTGVVIAGCLTSLTDTVDPSLNNNNSNQSIQKMQTDHLYCHVCRSKVKSETRHCKICNLCTEGFDHHCIWINNCIGKNNYKSFMIMLVLVLVNFCIFHSSLLVLWISQDWSSFIVSMIINWVFSFFLLITTILILILLCFHIFLIATNQTTLSFYISKKNSATIKPQKREERVNNTSQYTHNQKTQESAQSKKSSFLLAFNSNQSFNNSAEDPSILKQLKRSIQQPNVKQIQQVRNEQVLQNQKKEESEKETLNETAMIRRTKSYQYILGKIVVDTPTKRQNSKYQSARPNPSLNSRKNLPN